MKMHLLQSKLNTRSLILKKMEMVLKTTRTIQKLTKSLKCNKLMLMETREQKSLETKLKKAIVTRQTLK